MTKSKLMIVCGFAALLTVTVLGTGCSSTHQKPEQAASKPAATEVSQAPVEQKKEARPADLGASSSGLGF